MTAVYLDHMGNDLSVVNDARVSFGKESVPDKFEVVKIGNHVTSVPVLSAQDKGLIAFLARGCTTEEWEKHIAMLLLSGTSYDEAQEVVKWARRLPTHWTPFGHQIMKFRMDAPVPIRTQCFKHKIGFVENEESRRYIDSVPEIYIPEFRERPEGSIKQGSGGLHPDNEYWKRRYEAETKQAVTTYLAMIEAKIAPEQARLVLPQGAIVNWVWTGSLYGFAEFYNKRSDRSHAQAEIADLADQIGAIAEKLFPVSWPALTR